MINRSRITFYCAAAAGLTACSTMAQTEVENAILINPSDKVRAELSATLSQALNGRAVRIAPESFTASSRLILDPVQISMPNGTPATPENMARPDHFYLTSKAGKCYLFHVQTDRFFKLKHAECRAQSGEAE